MNENRKQQIDDAIKLYFVKCKVMGIKPNLSYFMGPKQLQHICDEVQQFISDLTFAEFYVVYKRYMRFEGFITADKIKSGTISVDKITIGGITNE